MTSLFSNIKLRQIVRIPIRCHKKDHWSVIKKRKTAKDKALEHFDEFYADVYGKTWSNIRAALLNENHKYMAVVNNFSDTDRIRFDLESLGAINLKSLYDVQKENASFLKTRKKSKNNKTQDEQSSIEAESSIDPLVEIKSTYNVDYPHLLQALKSASNMIVKKNEPTPIKLQSIDADLNEINIDTNRIVDSSANVSMLQEYVPVTKIKGLDDWVLESDHYKFYDQANDIKINIEKESVLAFPEHLHVYFLENGDEDKFPSPRKGSTTVSDYYLFDGGSILPVLALDIKLGDTVLDMCAAPGGKALTILQTLMPRVLVANDIMLSRVNRIRKVLSEFVLNVPSVESMLRLTEQDARGIDEKDVYNKILVDVPCTTDRHSLHNNENNIFKPGRVKERLKMPEIQSQILANALKLVSVGGTVVYSTCSLSPIQNDGVVQVALKKAWEESNCIMVVKDMTEALRPLKFIYDFGNINLKYGHIVIPTPKKNWGPMYFCKMVKIQ